MTDGRPQWTWMALLAAIALATAFFLFRGDRVATTEELEAPAEPVDVRPESANVERTPTPSSSRDANAAVDASDGRPPEYLAALGGIVGRLVDPNHVPLAGVPVALLAMMTEDLVQRTSHMDAALDWFDPYLATTRSGADGRFRFERIEPSAALMLSIDAGGPRATWRILDDPPRGPGDERDIGDVVLEDSVRWTGRVVTAGGAPVSGARVRAFAMPELIRELALHDLDPDGAFMVTRRGQPQTVVPLPRSLRRLFDHLPVPTATSDRDGVFAIEGSPFLMRALVLDEADGVPTCHDLLARQNVSGDVGPLVIDEGVRIAGRVVRSDGSPAVDATLLVGRNKALFARPLGSTVADGSFQACIASNATSTLCVRLSDQRLWHSFSLDPSEPSPVLTVPTGCSLTVIVLTPDGDSPAEFDVKLLEGYSGSGHTRDVAPEARSPIEGGVEFHGLPAREFQMWASAPGYASSLATAVLRDGDSTKVEVTLQPAKSLRVTVVDPSGLPVRHANVRAMWMPSFLMLFSDGPPPDYASARTGADGVAVLSDIPPAEYLLQVVHPAFATSRVDVPEESTEVTITLSDGARVDGRVLSADGSVGSPHWVVLTWAAEVPRVTRTDREGTFSFARLAAGERYHVAAYPGRSMQQDGLASLITQSSYKSGYNQELRFDLAEGEHKQVTLGGSPTSDVAVTVRGTVRLSGRPMVEGEVRLRQERQGAAAREITGRTDASGGFQCDPLDTLETKSLSLTIEPTVDNGERLRGMFYRQELALTPGQHADLQLEIPVTVLHGRVLSDGDDQPIAGAKIDLTGEAPAIAQPATGVATSRFRCDTDASGAFGVALLPAWTFKADVTAPGYAASRVTVDLSQRRELVVRLARFVTIQGSIAIPPLNGLRGVHLSFENGREQWVDRETLAFALQVLPGKRTYEVLAQTSEGAHRFRGDVIVPETGLNGVVLTPQESP